MIAGAVGSLLLGEVVVRVYSAVAFPRMMQVDPKIGWRHLPDRTKSFTNEDGETHPYRHDEWGHRPMPKELQSAARTTNVLVLGDSFAEAIQVANEDSFTSLIAKADPTLNVINTGVGGYSTVQQYLYLRDEGEQFDPDLVLLVAYENDLTDNCIAYSPNIGARPTAMLEGNAVRIIEDFDDEPYLKFLAPVPFASLLNRHSYLFYAFNDRVWRRLNREPLRVAELEDWSALDSDATKLIFLDVVDRIHQLATQRGAQFAAVYIPSAATLRTAVDPWHDVFAAHAAAEGFEFASLQPALRDPSHGRCFFEVDIHWTRTGHRVAAETILPVVQRALGAN